MFRPLTVMSTTCVIALATQQPEKFQQEMFETKAENGEKLSIRPSTTAMHHLVLQILLSEAWGKGS